MDLPKTLSLSRVELRNRIMAKASREIAQVNPKMFLQEIGLEFCLPQEESPLFQKLPLEIRLMILKHVVTPKKGKTASFHKPSLYRETSILLTCRQAYVEARLLNITKSTILIINSSHSLWASLLHLDGDARHYCCHYLIYCQQHASIESVPSFYQNVSLEKMLRKWGSLWRQPAFITVRANLNAASILADRIASVFFWLPISVRAVSIECSYRSRKGLAELDAFRKYLDKSPAIIQHGKQPLLKEVFCRTRKLTRSKAKHAERVCVIVFSKELTLKDLTQIQERGKLPLLFLDEFRLKGRIHRKLP